MDKEKRNGRCMQKNEKQIAGFLMGIIALLLLGSVAILFYHQQAQSATQVVEIYQNGSLVKSVPLETDDIITIYRDGNSYNTIRIKDGSVCVSEASCPNQLCVQMGEIHTASYPITCLPNRLVIRIRQGEGTDATVY